MLCEICSKFNKNPVYNDCVIEYLEKIKLHYNCLKTDFQDAKSSSVKLELENENLRKKISTLELELLSMDNNNLSSCKKRKTNSLTPENNDDNNTDNNNLNKKSNTPISKELSEELNKAMNITEVNWSDSFYSQTNNNTTSTPSTPKKTNNLFSNFDRDETPDLSPRKILSPNNKRNKNSPASSPSLHNKSSLLSSPNSSSTSLNYSHLPRRLKSSSFISKPKNNNENQNPIEINSKWISKESKNKNFGVISSFRQSDKTVSNSNTKNSPKISDDKSKKQTTIIKSPRKSLSLKKFRQQRLLFDIVKNENQKQLLDNDETFCDDIIQPSPTSLIIPYAEDGSKIKKKSLINFSRKKFDNNLFDFSSTKKTTIKTEPYTQKFNKNKKFTENKSSVSDINETNIIYDDNDDGTLKNVIEPNEIMEKNVQNVQNDDNNSSSIVMIPNEPDDVIIIDNTNIDYNKFSARQFIDEMIIESPDTSKFCKTINYGDLVKKTQLNANKNEQKNNTELDELLKSACQDCREYFKCIARNLTIEEIKQKIRNCKHKNEFVLNPTPEDFWNPCFNHFSENDPRNETLIDDRFIVKK